MRGLQARKAHSEFREILLLGIPTGFDLVATILMNIGLLSVTASVYQMMRGAEMLFAALFAVLFLHRSLNKFHLGGIACCVVRPAARATPRALGLQGFTPQRVPPRRHRLLRAAPRCANAVIGGTGVDFSVASAQLHWSFSVASSQLQRGFNAVSAWLRRSFSMASAQFRCAQVGISLVGVSSLQSGKGSASHPVSQWQMLAGMALIVASQVRLCRIQPSSETKP